MPLETMQVACVLFQVIVEKGGPQSTLTYSSMTCIVKKAGMTVCELMNVLAINNGQ